MKPRLSVGVCVLISLALVLVGLGYGTYGGFAEERQDVIDLLSGENGMHGVLQYRGADGLNLCVVAQRHLKNDAEVQALRQTAQTLTDEAKTLSQRREADAGLDAAVNAVTEKLLQTPSFTQSERDQRYVTMLKNDLQGLSQSDLPAAYNAAAEAFNQKLDGSPMGKLAGILGVKPCEIYEN